MIHLCSAVAWAILSIQLIIDNHKKLKSSGLKKLILKVCDEPMEAQNVFFNQHFKNWKGNCEQMDDVCLIGFRI